MFLLNLTITELLAVGLAVGGVTLALYLYDRSRRRQTVSTLRFFPQVSRSSMFVRRRKLREPWSLLLQILSMILLVLAVAELQLERFARNSRDHVLIIETSAWMNATNRSTGVSLMREAHRRALEYLKGISTSDRVMLIRADQLATPATPFTRNRVELEKAILASRAGSTALNLTSALQLARSELAQPASGRVHPGEIGIVGSGRVVRSEQDLPAGTNQANVRAMLLGAESGNIGIRKLAARRLPSDPEIWDVSVEVYNYTAGEHHAALTFTFGNSRLGSRNLLLRPHDRAETNFKLRSVSGGQLEAALDFADEYPDDNRAAIGLAALKRLNVQIFTDQPSAWVPLLRASPYIEPEFRRPAEFASTRINTTLIITEGFSPPGPVEANVISVVNGAVITVPHGRGAHDATPVRWNASHPVTSGIHGKDVIIRQRVPLRPKGNDVVLAEADGVPVLIASGGVDFKNVLFGFHPLEEGLENQLAIPLLFANIVRWISPDLFRAIEVSARPPGIVEIEAIAGTARDQIRISSPQESELPFTLAGNRVRFFAGEAATVRVSMPGRELTYGLNLPEVGDAVWNSVAGARRPPPAASASRDLWPWLAAAGLLGLMCEWLLYGREPQRSVRSVSKPGIEGRRRSGEVQSRLEVRP